MYKADGRPRIRGLFFGSIEVAAFEKPAMEYRYSDRD